METQSDKIIPPASEKVVRMPIPQRITYHITQPPFLNIAFVPFPITIYADSIPIVQKSAAANLEGPRKRGRRPKWPFIPKCKTEDFDKFWIRRYRTYLKKQVRKGKSGSSSDSEEASPSEFVTWFISDESQPGKQNPQYKSYNYKYKRHLLDQSEFINGIRAWYLIHGEKALRKAFDL
jgi:hypothetical protein